MTAVGPLPSQHINCMLFGEGPSGAWLEGAKAVETAIKNMSFGSDSEPIGGFLNTPRAVSTGLTYQVLTGCC